MPAAPVPHHESLAEAAESLRGVEALAGERAAAEIAGGSCRPTPETHKAEALGGHAARGFAFMLTQSVLTRIISFACQIALARLLLPEHYGLVALADGVATIANVLQLIGVREVLVSRPRKFHLWANPAFWITVTTGFVGAALVAAAAPVMAWTFGEPDLLGLMLVIALGIPLWAIALVPEARLQSQLRFRLLAGLAALQSGLMPLLIVAFALLGFGPYSFVMPRVVVGVIRLVIILRAARLDVHRDPQFNRWKFIVSSSAVIFFTSLLLLVVQVGERPVLGAFVGAHEVGLYFFAYSVSLQTIWMISANLESVLFATLAKLTNETARLLRAFLRASRVLAFLVVPVCLVQSAASDAAVRTVFGPKWIDAIPAMQVLGLAMVFFGAYCPASAMLQAQGRFVTRFKLAAANSACYLASVVLGVLAGLHFGGDPVDAVTGAAVGVAVTNAVLSPIWCYVTIRPMGGTWSDAVGIVAKPLLCSAVAVGIGLLAQIGAGRAFAGVVWQSIPLEHWARLVTVGAVSVAAYIPLGRIFMPDEFGEVAVKLQAALRRFWPGGAAALGRFARQRADGSSSTPAA